MVIPMHIFISYLQNMKDTYNMNKRYICDYPYSLSVITSLILFVIICGMGWSMVCECGMHWSYSLDFAVCYCCCFVYLIVVFVCFLLVCGARKLV